MTRNDSAKSNVRCDKVHVLIQWYFVTCSCWHFVCSCVYVATLFVCCLFFYMLMCDVKTAICIGVLLVR